MRHFIESIPTERRAYIAIVLAVLCWTGNIILARATVGEIPPFALAFWRWTLAFLILLVLNFSGLIRYRHAIIKHWHQIALLAMFSVVAYTAIFYLSAQTTTSVNITLVVATGPIISGVLAHWMLDEKLNASRIIGILISLVGVMIILSKGDLNNFINLHFTSGDLYMLLAVMSWAIYGILVRKWTIHLPKVLLLTVLAFFGLLGLGPLCYWESIHATTYVFKPHHAYIFLYLATLPTIIAYWLWMFSVKNLKQTVVSQFAYLQIVFTALLAYIFLGERLSLFHLVGGLLIVAGLYFAHITATNTLTHSN